VPEWGGGKNEAGVQGRKIFFRPLGKGGLKTGFRGWGDVVAERGPGYGDGGDKFLGLDWKNYTDQMKVRDLKLGGEVLAVLSGRYFPGPEKRTQPKKVMSREAKTKNKGHLKWGQVRRE